MRSSRRRWLAATALIVVSTAYAVRPARAPSHRAAASTLLTWWPTEVPRRCLAALVVAEAMAVRRGGLGSGGGRTVLAAGVLAGLALLRLDVRARNVDAELRAALLADAPSPLAASDTAASYRRGRDVRRARRRQVRTRDVAYGPHGSCNLLDVWRRPDPADRPAPVVLQIPGGAYVCGSKERRVYPVLALAVEAGWVGVSMSYRLAPQCPWPAQIIDVNRALDWIRANIGQYGGDPDFVAVVGNSAGAHLAALAALAGGNGDFRAGRAVSDPPVQAAVTFYGVYDWALPAAWPDLHDYLRRCGLLSGAQSAVAHLHEDASPIRYVNDAAPPFLVVHGSNDTFAPVAQARHFVRRLRDAGAVVRYAELDGAQHAFDVLGGQRAVPAARAALRFLDDVHRVRVRRPASQDRVTSHPAADRCAAW